MGQQGIGKAFVVMTNGDLYHMTPHTASFIKEQLEQETPPLFLDIYDTKSRMKVLLLTRNISSVVVQGVSDV